MYYGWRAKIGLILPATNTATERDFFKYAPEGVVSLGQRVRFEAVTLEQLRGMGDQVVEAAKLLAFAGCDLLVYGCTTGSMVGGIGYDQKLVDAVKKVTGLPLITTSIAVVDALHALGTKKICLVAPYPEDVNLMEKKFLEDSGFDVVSLIGVPCKNPEEGVHSIGELTYDRLYKLAKQAVTPDTEVIFMSCTGLGVIDQIDIAEKSFNLPVIASNYVTFWKALHTLGIQYDGPYLGRLMEI